MLTFGSLFAGIGGFDLGFERAGMRCLWQVEIDPFCQRVLAKHWPDVERFADVRECGGHNLQAVDVICGGFPCQPHSVAGKQRGAEDDRDLWPEMRRVIDELRPAWVVGENVPGIRGTILDGVLSDLEDMGYDAIPLGIPACGVGANHRRNRVFIVAYTEQLRNRCEAVSGKVVRQDTARPTSWIGRSGEIVAYAAGARCNAGGFVTNWPARDSARRQEPERLGWWDIEPAVGRVAHGVPNRVDRLRALGNAVVPQVAEWIGRQIVAVAAQHS